MNVLDLLGIGFVSLERLWWRWIVAWTAWTRIAAATAIVGAAARARGFASPLVGGIGSIGSWTLCAKISSVEQRREVPECLTD